MSMTKTKWNKIDTGAYRFGDTPFTVHGGDGCSWIVFLGDQHVREIEPQPTREFAGYSIQYYMERRFEFADSFGPFDKLPA